MFRFLFKLSLFLPISLGVAWVNWHVDPAKIFGGHASDPAWYDYERYIAHSLREGQPQPLAAQHNEVILDELMFRGFDHVDVLILGSSSAKPLHKELFGNEFVYNASVIAGNLEEMIAIDELARESGLHPRHVVLAIEPVELQSRVGPVMPSCVPLFAKAIARLHLNDGPERTSGWTGFFSSFVPAGASSSLGALRSLFEQYDTLISPSYCQYCLRIALRTSFSSRTANSPVVEQFPRQNQHLLYPDGSLEWCDVFLGQKPDDIRQSVPKPPIETIADEALRPAPERRRLLEAFVTDLLQSGAVVEFFLPPPNPWLFDEAERELQKAGRSNPTLESETYLRSFAAQHGIRVRGSFDPHRAGVTEEDYVDFVHLRREAIGRLWNRQPSPATH